FDFHAAPLWQCEDHADYIGRKTFAIWRTDELLRLWWLRTGSLAPLNVDVPKILVAILARNKAYCLPDFLRCIQQLEYPKQKLALYIHTNDNVDDTDSILRDWIDENRKAYSTIDFEAGLECINQDSQMQ